MATKRRNEARSAVAAVLGHPLRMALVERLLGGPCIVNELVAGLGAEQAVVSKQLGLLRAAGLLRCDPEGRLRRYSLADAAQLRRLVTALDGTAERAAVQAARCRKEAAAAGRATGRAARAGR
jgi:ArsR family transcriptional regulator